MKEYDRQICMAYIENENIGSLTITASPKGITSCEFNSISVFEHAVVEQEDCVDTDAAIILANAINQVNAYLHGKRKIFDVPIDWRGISTFTKSVYQTAMQIPFGEVRTYGELALVVENPKAARAVGRAMATNPFVLIVPCHRVIASSGHLNGFSAPNGLETKRWLLEHEGHAVRENQLA